MSSAHTVQWNNRQGIPTSFSSAASHHASGPNIQTFGFTRSHLERRAVSYFCKLLALHLGSDVGEEEEKGCCTSTSCRQPCTVNGDPFGGSWHPLCLAQVGNPAEGRLLCCPTPPPPCLRAAARLSFTCLFSSLAFHYPASSYLCPLLKADLFISESLSVLCPSFHLLANLFYLLSAWH